MDNCPFCEADPIRLELQPVYGDDTTAVHCMDCDAWGPTARSVEEAEELWDKAPRK